MRNLWPYPKDGIVNMEYINGRRQSDDAYMQDNDIDSSYEERDMGAVHVDGEWVYMTEWVKL